MQEILLRNNNYYFYFCNFFLYIPAAEVCIPSECFSFKTVASMTVLGWYFVWTWPTSSLASESHRVTCSIMGLILLLFSRGIPRGSIWGLSKFSEVKYPNPGANETLAASVAMALTGVPFDSKLGFWTLKLTKDYNLMPWILAEEKIFLKWGTSGLKIIKSTQSKWKTDPRYSESCGTLFKQDHSLSIQTTVCLWFLWPWMQWPT